MTASVSSTLLFLWWMHHTLKLFKDGHIKTRAVAKQIAFEQLQPEAEKTARAWLITTLVFSLVPVFWVSYFCYATDYSFMIGLFPVLWYYFLLRYLFWEKSDLNEKKKN